MSENRAEMTANESHPWHGRLLLVVVMTPLVLFLPVLLAGKALFWGTPMLQFMPWWDLAWDQLGAGSLPLWNNLSGMGAPLLANYQSALFYPPHWIYLLTYLAGGRLLMAWTMAIMVAAHLAFAGLGMSMLVRRLGMGGLSQSVAGLAFGMCGYLVSRAGFLSINAAAAWIPWILLGLTPKTPGEWIPTAQRLALIACLAFQLLAGHAQTTWNTWLLAVMWVVFMAWMAVYPSVCSREIDAEYRRTDQARGQRLVYGLVLLITGFLPAAALAAAQLVPTAEFLAFSQRSAAVDYEMAMTYSFWPWRLSGAFTPDLFGNPAQGDYWGYGNYWEDAIYIGMLPILLGLSALLAGFRKDISRTGDSPAWQGMNGLALSREFRVFLLLLSAISLVLALGKNTPVFPWLYRHLPGFDSFQAPSRYLVWLEVALCLAAALGAETWHRPQRRALYWTRLATAGALAVALGAGLAWKLLGEVQPTFLKATALAGLWAVGAGLLSLAAPLPGEVQPERRMRRIAIWQWLVIGWIAADLLVAGMGLNPGIELQAYGSSPAAQAVGQQLGGQRIYISPTDEQELKYGTFLRFDSFSPAGRWQLMRSSLLPNLNLLDRVSSVNNFDPLVPGNYASWMKQIENTQPSVQMDLFRLMDIGLVQHLGPGKQEGLQLEQVDGGRRFRWVPCSLSVAHAAEALQLAVSGTVDFDLTVILQGAGMGGGTCQASGLTAGEPIIQEGPSELRISLEAPEDGYLVISDTWYPGWRAWVNGEAAPVLPANFMFKAVPVQEGKQLVVLRYQPRSFYLGGLVSLLALVSLVYCGIKKCRP